ncbi:TPA: hypothetical protein ACG5DM_004196 [Pseudomonas putida]|jgi:hypothetical protein|uniref:Transmembrane protein n=2 Tax=Pseudomonas TaxID=286 RepID=A0AAJ5SAF1_9PSED|nr:MULTISPECIES: hypothetical protein [Pseudomonas]MCT8166664.1 hypothetical protein [Pseudomonas sp. HD6422]MCT8185560.1 hypothetical protein [Pseudomonas sp. HD6421]MDM1714470.1 hypothetical protein [Pseudomonas sp. 165]ORL48036.1 hypothetical protein B7H18_29185 [Pseudomonas putida]ORL62889.1 hypothetical protein B7H19_27310 [Pseudomonas putida]
MVSKTYSTKKLAIIAIAALAWFLGTVVCTYALHPIVSGYTLVISAAVLMAAALYWLQDRLTKGWSLVGLAVTTTWMYGYIIEPKFAALAPRPGDWISLSVLMIKTLIECLNLACAGAGGSIIASDGEHNRVELPIHGRAPGEENAPQGSEQLSHLSSSIHLKLDGQAQLVRSLETTLQVLTSEHRQLKRLIWICAGSVGALVALALVTLNH